MTPNGRCETCVASTITSESDSGECRFNPPVFFNAEGYTGWPRVDRGQWCLQWREREWHEKENT